MIGRADIEGSKSNVAMNAWLPQASYPCGNFSDTSSVKFPQAKGSIGHAFTVCASTESQNQMSFYPFVPQEISVDARDLCRTQYARIRFFWIDVSSTREGEEILANVECNRNQRTSQREPFSS